MKSPITVQKAQRAHMSSDYSKGKGNGQGMALKSVRGKKTSQEAREPDKEFWGATKPAKKNGHDEFLRHDRILGHDRKPAEILRRDGFLAGLV